MRGQLTLVKNGATPSVWTTYAYDEACLYPSFRLTELKVSKTSVPAVDHLKFNYRYR